MTLQLNNDDDYIAAIDGLGKKRPSPLRGRGLINIDGQFYEFQTGRIVEDEELNAFLRENIAKLASTNSVVAMPIRTLDGEVTFEDFKDQMKDIKSLPIGINKTTLNVYKYDFEKNYMNPLVAKSLDDIVEFLKVLLREFKELNKKIYLFDYERKIDTEKRDFEKLYKAVINKLDSEEETNNIFVIIGISGFMEEAGIDDTTFGEDVSKLKDKCIFVLADTETQFKDKAYEDWYGKYLDADNGIWIGKGIEDQYHFSFDRSPDIDNDCDGTFGVAFKSGKPTMIKFIGVKEKKEEEEE
jgi:S-DNA-T family DNA segregation ATPase FtsK/SpoIIIE